MIIVHEEVDGLVEVVRLLLLPLPLPFPWLSILVILLCHFRESFSEFLVHFESSDWLSCCTCDIVSFTSVIVASITVHKLSIQLFTDDCIASHRLLFASSFILIPCSIRIIIASIFSSISDDTSISSLLHSVMEGSPIPLISLLGSEVFLLTYLSSLVLRQTTLHLSFHQVLTCTLPSFLCLLCCGLRSCSHPLGFFHDSRDTTFSQGFSFFLSLAF